MRFLVNNASWTGTGDAIDVTEEEYDKTFDASVKSVFFASQAAARVMLQQANGGRIIHIGSKFRRSSLQKASRVCSCKAAVHHMSKALSLEWASKGVLVNTIAPCITETESR